MLQNHANLQRIRAYLLKELGRRYPDSEANSMTRIILEHAGYTTTAYLLDPEQLPGPEIVTQINEIVADIHTGKPIQYILGYAYFCDQKITVNENVLIPRPETEEMVYRIISHHPIPPARLLDVGTGSGCIALALKAHFAKSAVSGMEVNTKALEVAKANAGIQGLDVSWIEGDMRQESTWKGLDPLDLIASNPPYVLRSERAEMEDHVVAFEPESALFVEDSNPLEYYEAIARHGIRKLKEEGSVWVEINARMGVETSRLFNQYGFREVTILKDIHERERFIRAVK